MEDTQIIALYLSRQEAAIGETAKKYGGYINRIAYNILRCREDTEESVFPIVARTVDPFFNFRGVGWLAFIK